MTRLNLPVALALALAGQAVAQTGTPIYVYPPQQQTPAQTPPSAPLTMPSSIQYSPAAPATNTPPSTTFVTPSTSVSAPATPATSPEVTVGTVSISTTPPPAVAPSGPAPLRPVPQAPALSAPTETMTIPQPGSGAAGVQSAPTAPETRTVDAPAAAGAGPALSPALNPALSVGGRRLWGGLNYTSSATNLGVGASLTLGQFRGFPLIGRGLGEFGSLKPANAADRKTYLALRGDLLAEYALGRDSAVYAGPGLELGQRRAVGLTAGYRRSFNGPGNPFGSGLAGAFVEGQLERAWAGGTLGNQGGLRAGVTYRF